MLDRATQALFACAALQSCCHQAKDVYLSVSFLVLGRGQIITGDAYRFTAFDADFLPDAQLGE